MINSEASEIIEAKEIQYEFEANNLDNRSMSMDKKRNIYLICKELINNALKHSQCTKIVLRCSVKASHLSICFSDNGKGFDVAAVDKKRNSESGMGLLFMKERIQYINGRVFMNSIPGEGTRITFNIPILKSDN